MTSIRPGRELRQLCRNFLNAALYQLEVEGYWPRPIETRNLQMGRDFYQTSLTNLAEFQELARHLMNDELLLRMYTHRGQQADPNEFLNLVERLFVYTVHESRGHRIESNVFDRWYRRFSRELYRESGRWRSFKTLTGVRITGRPFRFDKQTKLVPTPGWDLARHSQGQEIEFTTGFPGGYDNSTLITNFTLRKDRFAGSSRPHPPQVDDWAKAGAIATAIRLLKGGSPRVHCSALVHISAFPLTDAHGWCRMEGQHRMDDEEVLIEPQDHFSIRSLARNLLETHYGRAALPRQNSDRMNIAIGRFDDSLRLQSWEETFLDFGIILESLLGVPGSGELSYRLASRTAWLLGTDDESTIKIYRQVRAIYAIRSLVAHGSQRDEAKLRRLLQDISGLTSESWQELWDSIQPALRSADKLVRTLVLACLTLRRIGYSDSVPNWPLPDDFDSLAWTRTTRTRWQQVAGVR